MKKYIIFVFLASLYGIYKIDNYFTSQMISRYAQELNNPIVIDGAIKYLYPSVYESLAELRVDYPEFIPKIYHWSEYGSATFKYFNIGWGIGLFAIQLPDEAVIINAEGKPITSRSCPIIKGDSCVVVVPKNPEQGIVGKLLRAKKIVPANNFEFSWSSPSEGKLEIVGNCFKAYKPKPDHAKLLSSRKDSNYIIDEFNYGFGFYSVEYNLDLEALKSGKIDAVTRGVKRIRKADFINGATCE